MQIRSIASRLEGEKSAKWSAHEFFRDKRSGRVVVFYKLSNMIVAVMYQIILTRHRAVYTRETYEPQPTTSEEINDVGRFQER